MIDITAEQNAVNAASDAAGRSADEAREDGRVLEETRNQIQLLQKEIADVESQRALLQQRLTAASAEAADLETTRGLLVVVKTSILDCLHTVDKALTSAQTLDNQMSLSNFSTAVKGLIAALRLDGSFLGEVATLDEASFKHLDDSISAIKKRIASKLLV